MDEQQQLLLGRRRRRPPSTPLRRRRDVRDAASIRRSATSTRSSPLAPRWAASQYAVTPTRSAGRRSDAVQILLGGPTTVPRSAHRERRRRRRQPRGDATRRPRSPTDTTARSRRSPKLRDASAAGGVEAPRRGRLRATRRGARWSRPTFCGGCLESCAASKIDASPNWDDNGSSSTRRPRACR